MRLGQECNGEAVSSAETLSACSLSAARCRIYLDGEHFTGQQQPTSTVCFNYKCNGLRLRKIASTNSYGALIVRYLMFASPQPLPTRLSPHTCLSRRVAPPQQLLQFVYGNADGTRAVLGIVVLQQPPETIFISLADLEFDKSTLRR